MNGLLTKEDYEDSIGKFKGNMSNKYNRAQKLFFYKESLIYKFTNMIERGRGVTLNARLAYACIVLMETGIRVGNESSAEGYICQSKYDKDYGKKIKTYGIVTLLGEHVKKFRTKIDMEFVGKRNVANSYQINYKPLVKYFPKVKPKELWLGITYNELFKFVKKHIGKKYNPKDLRTMKANELFLDLIHKDNFRYGNMKVSHGNKIITHKVKTVAAKLSHTPAICRRAYLSPALLEWYKWDLMGWLE